MVGKTVIGLNNHQRIAQISGVLVNPYRLTVVGFWVKPRYQSTDLLLLSEDIRQLTSQRALVNDQSVLTSASDLPKLSRIIEIGYSIVGKKIVGDQRQLGRAIDFNFHNTSYEVSHIVGRGNRWQRLKMTQLMFSRSQIIRVDSHQIIVDIGPKRQRLPSVQANPA